MLPQSSLKLPFLIFYITGQYVWCQSRNPPPQQYGSIQVTRIVTPEVTERPWLRTSSITDTLNNVIQDKEETTTNRARPPSNLRVENPPGAPRAQAPSNPAFLTQPSDTAGYENGTAVLACVLAPSATGGTAKTECGWRRKSIPVEMGGRYTLVASNKSGIGIDCSLRLSSLQRQLDEGGWQCGHGAVWSVIATLSITVAPPPPATIIRHPANANVLEGEEATLLCQFNGTVNCTWKRDGHTVVVGERYVYVNSGYSTIDCSVRIPKVLTVDAGMWRCGRLGTDTPLWSNEARLQVQVPVAPGKPAIAVSRLPLSDPSGGLECTADAAFPAARLIWQLGEEWMEGEQRVTDAGRRGGIDGSDPVPLFNTRLIWNGTGGWGPFSGARSLRCWVKHPGLPVPLETSIPVIHRAIAPSPPEMLRDNQTVSEISLQNPDAPLGRLECLSRGGNPAAQLSWEVDGQQRAAGPTNETFDGDNLFSSRLQWAQSGGQVRQFNASKVLRCVGRHPAWDKAGGPRHATLYFTRNYAATNAQILRLITSAGESRPSALHCTADGFPLPDFSWEYRLNASGAWRSVGSGPEVRVEGRVGHFRCTSRNALNKEFPARHEVRIDGAESAVLAFSGPTIALAVLLIYSLLLTFLLMISIFLFAKKKWIFSSKLKRSNAT